MIEISTDKSRLDISYIHNMLKTQYWAKNIPRDIVEKSIENSFCFGIYRAHRQIGFSRVITDFTIFAYIADVFVDPEEQGKGVAKQMIQDIVSHEALKGIRRWHLLTRDAHPVYRTAGFSSLSDPSRHMEKICRPDYAMPVDR